MAARTFENEDEEGQFCLSALRDGTSEEKIVARERLAAIFFRRHLFEEAAELYELNVRAGVRSPELLERLSETYRQLGDSESAEAALVEARRLHATTAPSAATARPHVVDVESRMIPFPAAAARLPVQQNAPELAALPDASVLDRPQRQASSLPGPIRVFGIVLILIVLPVMLLALLVVNPIGLFLEGRPAGPTVNALSAEPPRLKIAAGTSAAWYLQTGRSVSGLWATPGLELTLDQDLGGAGSAFTVAAPRPQGWGETITIVERRGQGRANQETIVLATFEAPANLPSAGTIFHGRIVGHVMAPRLNESGQFSTSTESIDLPVQIEVVSGFDLWLDRFGSAVQMYFKEDRWLLVTIGALLAWCALAGGAAILYRTRHA